MHLTKSWAKAGAIVALTGAMVALTGAAQAALVSRGGGMVYDTTRNLTWLADMNHAFTSGYAASGVAPGSAIGSNTLWTDGRMGWAAANAWAAQLDHGGFSDWRLPTLNPADTSCSRNYDPGGGLPRQYDGFNCTGGELSGLFVTDLGNKPNESVLNPAGDTAEQMANLALFSNLQSYEYWSGTEFAPGSSAAWRFSTFSGAQVATGKDLVLYAVAVRSGDVIASVPEPQTLAMALLALGATVAARRRRSR